MKNQLFNTSFVIIVFMLIIPTLDAQINNDKPNQLKKVPIKHYIFSKTDNPGAMWSALYIASNNKIYIGTSSHADAAIVYEFDISTSTMKHLANLSILLNERGKAIWTNGKIHVRMQELDGYVYFGSFCEDSGPPAIDARSYNGPNWFRINMESGNVEALSKINSFWGITGQTMDKKRRIIYGLDEAGHLNRYFIDEDYSEDMGRVDSWDVVRTIFIDESGNVFGSYPPGRIWKYDVKKNRIFNLEYLRLPVTLESRTMANPMLDRRAQWRVIEWDPVDKVAYGIVGGSNLLFKFDVNGGLEGEITPLTPMCAPSYLEGRFFDIPHATLAFTINQKNRKIYYIPVTMGDFDYGLIDPNIDNDNKKSNIPLGFDERSTRTHSLMIAYDLKTGKREDIGILQPTDGSFAIGMQSAGVDKNGKIWFCGQFEQTDAALMVNGGFRNGLGLGCYDPFMK